ITVRTFSGALILGISSIAMSIVAPAVPLVPEHALDHILVKFKPAVGNQLGSNAVPQKLQMLLGNLRLPPGTKLEEPALNGVLRARTGAADRLERADVNLHRFF